MVRNKNLIPLSHQHQRALALCVRIGRAQPIRDGDLEVWQRELEQMFAQEIEVHFVAEEVVVFPAARRFSDLTSLVEELVLEHAALREFFSRAVSRQMSAESLGAFAHGLAAHIRKEERRLFEGMQLRMDAAELNGLGTRLERALKKASQSCTVSAEAARLRFKG